MTTDRLLLAIAAPPNVDKVEATFKEELAKMLKDGFPEEEIAEAKKGWAAGPRSRARRRIAHLRQRWQTTSMRAGPWRTKRIWMRRSRR